MGGILIWIRKYDFSAKAQGRLFFVFNFRCFIYNVVIDKEGLGCYNDVCLLKINFLR